MNRPVGKFSGRRAREGTHHEQSEQTQTAHFRIPG
jgi:hypothetical protein